MPTAASLSKKISEGFDISSVPKDKLDEYKATFALFDKNNDGKITAKELGEVLGFLGQTPSEDELMVCVLFHNST
jgi:Ca2+-binding EF-hand superfamily protein